MIVLEMGVTPLYPVLPLLERWSRKPPASVTSSPVGLLPFGSSSDGACECAKGEHGHEQRQGREECESGHSAAWQSVSDQIRQAYPTSSSSSASASDALLPAGASWPAGGEAAPLVEKG